MMTYSEIVAFHGHSCPGLAVGYRMSRAAMDALSEMRSGDEQLVAIGKGNLIFRDFGKQVFTLYSRDSRKGVRVLFHGDGMPQGVRGDRDGLAEWLLKAPAEAMLSVREVRIGEPEPARIHNSVSCAVCGERVMETRLQRIDGKLLCIPCAERQDAPRRDVEETPSDDICRG